MTKKRTLPNHLAVYMGKTYYHWNPETEKKEVWGRVVDICPDTEVVTLYKRGNPLGLRYFTSTADRLCSFLKNGAIWL